MNTFWCQISYQMVNVRGLIDDIAFAQPQSTDKDDDQQNKSLFRQRIKERKAKAIAMDLVSELILPLNLSYKTNSN